MSVVNGGRIANGILTTPAISVAGSSDLRLDSVQLVAIDSPPRALVAIEAGAAVQLSGTIALVSLHFRSA